MDLDYHKPMYSKDVDENINQRIKIISKCVNSPKDQAVFMDLCRNDLLAFVNLFVWTYDPRVDTSKTPFITYPFQDDFLLAIRDHIEGQKDLLVDKSRDMGVSWCVLVAFTWFWLFKGSGYDFLCGSRKEQYVDKIGDMATLLQKIRFIFDHLPKWMMPKGFNSKDHATYMRLINPESGNTITGEATNANFSRGGRQRAIFFDEFAFWDNDNQAWRSSADTTNCRIAVSTPFGFDNHFAKLRHNQDGSLDMISLHWTKHPKKAKDAYNTVTKLPIHLSEAFNEWQKTKNVSSPWYENEVKRRGDDLVAIAQELDISYEGSQEGVLFEWEEMERAKKCDIYLSKDRKVIAIDPANAGDDEAVLYVSNNGMIAEKRILKRTTTSAVAAEAVALAYKHRVQVIISDAIGNDVLALIKELLGNNPNQIKIVAFKSSEKAENTYKYFNKRAEAYHEASLEMKYGRLQMDDDYILSKQLSATKYKKKNGRIIVIPKEEIKQVCGSSPDRADAWVLIPQALKLTHSRTEVEYKQKYRRTFITQETSPLHAYGDWQDCA